MSQKKNQIQNLTRDKNITKQEDEMSLSVQYQNDKVVLISQNNKIDQKEDESNCQTCLNKMNSLFCGCRQTYVPQVDNENEKSEIPKKKTLDPKKIGNFLKTWMNKTRQPLEIIFDILNQSIKDFDASVIKFKEKKYFIITDDFKMIYYDFLKKQMVKEDFIKSHIVTEKFQPIFKDNNQLTFIQVTPDCKQYFLGFSNGQLHVLDAVKFKILKNNNVFEQSYDLDKSAIIDIMFHKKLLFIAHESGVVNIFKKKMPTQIEKNGPSSQNEAKKYIFDCQIKSESKLYQMAVTENGKFLVGVHHKNKEKGQKDELKLINNLSSEDSDISDIKVEDNKDQQIKQALIYLIPFKKLKQTLKPFKSGEINFETKRLFLVTQQKVLLISDTMNGIQIFSLKDFEIEGQFKKMHDSQILDFLILEDQNTLITTGKDKRMKIWDLDNQSILKQLPIQKQIYSTLGISRDYKYLVTGGKSQIVFWYTSNWQKLCTLNHEITEGISSLTFSQNDFFLSAKDQKTNDIIYWQLSDTSLCLDFKDQQIIRSLMTLNNKFLITENTKGQAILWSIETRSLLKVLVQNLGFKQEFNSTSDSKYIFFKIDIDQLVQFNLETMKQQKTYICESEITFTCIDSHNKTIFISTVNKKLQIFDIKIQSEKELALLSLKQQNKDQENVAVDKDYFPTFALSFDNNIIVISVDGEKTFILDVRDRKYPAILFENKDKQKINKNFISNFYQNLQDNQFKNIKSFTIDHSGDQIILVDGQKAAVLQLQDVKTDEKASIKSIFPKESDQNQKLSFKSITKKLIRQRSQQYQYIQNQVLFKLSQEDDFYAYYVEKESLVLTKLNQTWSLWCTQNYKKWEKILDFEGNYQVVRGNNRMLIGLIDEDNQIKFISRKLLTDLSGKNENFISKSIQKFEIENFIKEHIQRNTSNVKECFKDFYFQQKQEIYLRNLSKIQNHEKHHILILGKIKKQELIIADKRIRERLDYDVQRRRIQKLYPKSFKTNQNDSESYFKNEIKLSGPINYLFPYILKEMMNDQKNITNYIDSLKRNNIYPFNINILHYFTNQNKIHCMNACIDYGIKYNRDRFNFTPLTYALKNNSMKTIENILTHAVDHNHSEIISTISQKEICQLIQQSPQNLIPFLDNSYMQIQEDIYIFGEIKSQGFLKSTIYYFLQNIVLLDKKDAQKYFITSQELQEKKKQGLPINLNVLQFKYNFTLGSQDSLSFHWALEKSKSQVFRCYPVQKIIQYKWQYLQYIAQIQFLITFAFCIILILHLYNLNQKQYNTALIIFCVYFSIFQTVSFASGNIRKLMQDIWTIFDVTFLLLLIFYLIFEIALEGIFNHQKYFLAFLNFISWLRCVSLLRGFKSTRMFIKQVVMIIFELRSFLIVLIGAVLTVASTYTMLTNDSIAGKEEDLTDFENYSYLVWEYVFSQFPAAYLPQYLKSPEVPITALMTKPGLFPLDQDIQYQLVLHFFGQVFISLIMMNLVIAIINDTLQKSMANNQQEDFKELNNMILFYEKLMFWRKNEGTPQYLHWLDYDNNMDDDDKIDQEDSQLDKLNQKMDILYEESIKDQLRIDQTEKHIIKLAQTVDKIYISIKKLESNENENKKIVNILSNRQ